MKKISSINSRTIFALPYLIFMTMFVIVPLGLLFFRAFYEGGFSFDAVDKYFGAPGAWETIWRSLQIAFTAAALCILIGYPVAYIISRIESKTTQAILLMLMIAPMWVNGLLRTIALRDLAGIIGIERGTFLLVIGLTIDFLPFMVMPIYLVLSGINKQYSEVSADLGATPIITFAKVTLPLSTPGIISGFLMVFTPAVSTFYMSEWLHTGRGTVMIGEQLNLWLTKEEYSVAAVIALVLLALVGLSVLLTHRLSKIGNTKGGLY